MMMMMMIMMVSRFMKGIFELRPPQPKLCSIWSVSKVLSYFAEREPLDGLTLKALTLKFTFLLALTSAARAQLAALDITCALMKQEACEFTILIHVKNARPNHPPRKIVLSKYEENPKICVVRCLNRYLRRTKDIRQGSNLLVSHVKPHKAIGRQTVSRWLSTGSTAIQQAGVDLSFTGYSTQAAATSEAADSGIPLELKLEAADSSSARTFEKHYHKATTQGQFAQSVLSLGNS